MLNEVKQVWTQAELDAYVSSFGLNLPADQRQRMLGIAQATAALGNRLVRSPSKFDEPANVFRLPLA